MKKYLINTLVFILLISSLVITVFAHSGRTDSSGGHKDNKNASGLGSYHYHCGGHPAHLHTNGICPYSKTVTEPTTKAPEPTTKTPEPTTSPKPTETTTEYIAPKNDVAPVKETTPKTGDVLGNVLYSDVTAYINGKTIPSYNIDGNTMIIAEDLANYGFDVVWNDKDSTLKVDINSKKEIKPLTVEKNTKAVGSVRFQYVYTTVKTYVSDAEVKGYNINGQTIIQFDELSIYGSITWDNKTKEIKFTSK